MEETPDEALVARARTGDRDAFVVLVERYRRLVLSLSRQMLGPSADAEDLAQETFLRAYRHLDGFRGQASFKTWLVRIAVNLCGHARRRVGREVSLATEVDGPAVPRARAEDGPEGILLDHEAVANVRRALAELPLHYRSVVVLRDLQGLSYREIAEALAIPPGTVMSRLAKARERLRVSLSPYWGRSDS